jgi:hypothetical protein
MAARLNPRHSEMVRAKIQASQLVNRLTDHALGSIEMTATQVQAAKILLDKTLSNAPTVTHVSGPEGGPVQITAIEIAPVAAGVKATG